MTFRVATAIIFLACLSCVSHSPKEEIGGAHRDISFTEVFRRTNGWVAGDGALSIPLPDGRSLWVFGDSHIDDLDPRTQTLPCLFQARNAGFVMDPAEPSAVLTLVGRGRGFRSWFKNSLTDDQWFWPMSGFQFNGTIYVYLSGLRKAGKPGMWDFKASGQDFWGKLSYPQIGAPAYTPLPDFKGITFGHGLVPQGDFVYAFGARQRKDASDVYVARFKAANPDSLWAFWDGHFWSPNPAEAIPIARGASTSIHVCKVRDKFLLTTSEFSIACDQGKDIYISTSAQPTGPFSPLRKIYSIDDTWEGHRPFFYFPVVHPQFIDNRNEVLLTYSINGYAPCYDPCHEGRMLPDHYRPQAIRVPLRLIDPAFK